MVPQVGNLFSDKPRLYTGFLLIVLAALLLYVGGVLLRIAATGIAVACFYEYFSFALGGSVWERARHTAAAMLLPLGFCWSGLPGLVVGIATALLAICLIQIVSIETAANEPNYSTGVPAAIGGLLYPGLPVTLLTMVAGNPGLRLYTVWLVAIVIASDTFAYFGGRALGKAKMAPRISPKKTWNGAYIGFVSAVLVGWLLARWLKLPMTSWEAIWFAVVIAVLAPLGDLVESLIKRIYGVKDSSQLLPGHGGILDRVDALIFAAPVLFFVPL